MEDATLKSHTRFVEMGGFPDSLGASAKKDPPSDASV